MFVSLVTAYSCQSKESNKNKSRNTEKPGLDSGAQNVKQFSGYNMEGQKVSCSAPGENVACTMIYGPEEEFKARCEAAGHQAFICGCHDYLCSENLN